LKIDLSSIISNPGSSSADSQPSSFGKLLLSQFSNLPLSDCATPNSIIRFEIRLNEEDTNEILTDINLNSIVSFLANDTNTTSARKTISYQNLKSYQEHCANQGTAQMEDKIKENSSIDIPNTLNSTTPNTWGGNLSSNDMNLITEIIQRNVMVNGHITLQVALSNNLEKAFYVHDLPFQQLVSINIQ